MFSAMAGLESWWMQKGGAALDLSEQQLLDCSHNFYNLGGRDYLEDCNDGGKARA